VKKACMSREEVPMLGMRKEEVILASAIVEVGVVDVSVE
jgi:hypothetical protein